MSTITPLSPTPPLGSYTSRQGASRSEAQTTLLTGEIIKAIVVEARPGDQYLLEIAGNRFTALSSSVLTPGQQLQLQVISTSPQLELQIVADSFSALTGRSLILLGNSIDLTALLTTLMQGTPAPLSQLSNTSETTLSSFAPETLNAIINTKEGGEFLKTLLNKIGLNLESLLAHGAKDQASATLKAALLEIVNRFQHSEKITEQAGKLLATIELYQLAQVQLDQKNLLLFPLPFPFLDQGYLLIDQDRNHQPHSQQNDDELRFTLHFSMSGLGHVKIGLMRKPDGLYVRFFLESNDKAQFVAQFEQDLRAALTDIPLVAVNFSEGAGDPATELVRLLIPKDQSILNTTV